MTHSCSGCDKIWGGLKICHCGACHETFSTPGNFDKHRSQYGPRGRCVDPISVGLHFNGVWRKPPHLPEALPDDLFDSLLEDK